VLIGLRKGSDAIHAIKFGADFNPHTRCDLLKFLLILIAVGALA